MPLVYEVTEGNGRSPHGSHYDVKLNGQLLFQARSEGDLNCCLERSVTSRLTRALRRYHLFHAGAVARNGRGMVLPGTSGVGKSTIVGALALSGFDYCSDEVAVLDRDLRLWPFPKVISLKPGGWRRLVQDFPAVTQCHLASASGSERGGIQYLQPPQFPNHDRQRSGYPVDFIVVFDPNRSKGAALRRVPKSRALAILTEQCLDLPLWGEPGFDLIVDLVQRAECYALNAGSLPRAAAELQELMS